MGTEDNDDEEEEWGKGLRRCPPLLYGFSKKALGDVFIHFAPKYNNYLLIATLSVTLWLRTQSCSFAQFLYNPPIMLTN